MKKKYTIEGIIQDYTEDSFWAEYKRVTGGEKKIGLTVPDGYPAGVEEMGGPMAVYVEAMNRGIPWEQLLNYRDPYDEDKTAII